MSGGTGAADDLWSFALRVYAGPGVTAACLDLQDRCRVDVCLLLAALWAGRRGRRLDDDAVAACRSAAATWSGEVIEPVRTARRTLGSRRGTRDRWVAAAVTGAYAGLRDIELALERAELDELAGLIDRRSTEGTPSARLAARLIRRLTGHAGDERPHLMTLLRAGFLTTA